MPKCNICKQELPYVHPDIEEPYKKMGGKPVCLGCWCSELGELIERWPIGGY